MTDWVTLGKKCVNEARNVLHGLKKVDVVHDRMNIQTSADLKSHATIKKVLIDSEVSCNLVSLILPKV